MVFVRKINFISVVYVANCNRYDENFKHDTKKKGAQQLPFFKC